MEIEDLIANNETNLTEQEMNIIEEEFLPNLLEVSNYREFEETLRSLRRKHSIQCKRNILYMFYMKNHYGVNDELEKILISKKMRSQSGVLVIGVTTSPYPKYEDPVTGEMKTQRFSCKHDCAYCPNQKDMPRSYLQNGPATRRGFNNEWDPLKQFNERALNYMKNGHVVDKIELIVLGGTWSEYPRGYQEWYVKMLFYSANVFFDKDKREPKSLPEEHKLNETARARIIGLTLETRPDVITLEEVKQLRYYGCTRVQLGIQHIDPTLLDFVRRGHYVEHAIKAVKMLKNNGFKVSGHFMPMLPNATPQGDIDMFMWLFTTKEFQVDQMKIYPLSVTKHSPLEKKLDSLKLYSIDELVEVMLEVKKHIPKWIRIDRAVRDIPVEYIIGGCDIPHMRNILEDKLNEIGLKCNCMRCREIKLKKPGENTYKLYTYECSGGIEHYLTFEGVDNYTLYAFLRLRLCKPDEKEQLSELRNCALIREVHSYGQLISVNRKRATPYSNWSSQNKRYGEILIRKACNMAYREGFYKIAVISGIGTREYYRRLGFRLTPEGTYMIKHITVFVYLYNIVWLFFKKI